MGLDKPVHPGETIDLNYSLAAPQTEGIYTLQADIVKEAYFWGEYLGNQPWQKKIKITTQATQILPGDLNSDGRVDILDLRQLFSSFTSIFDYNLVVGNFGN